MSEALSKRLAWLLRHRPDAAGMGLAPGGWAPIAAVTAALGIDREELDAIVSAPGRRRYEIAGDRVRALHGHSVDVTLEHGAAVPPERLFHGTVRASLRSIRKRGLVRGRRLHVHLSSDVDEARTIGARRGAPIVLVVRARAMHDAEGTRFSRAPGTTIWLVDHVPAAWVVFPDDR